MNANEMLRTLAGATGLTRQQADDALIAGLTVLSEVVSAEETPPAPGDAPITPDPPKTAPKSESDPDDPPVPQQPGLDQQYQQEARNQHTRR